MAHFFRVPAPPPPPEAPRNLTISGWTGHPKKDPKWLRETLSDLDAGLAVLDEVEAELDRQESSGPSRIGDTLGVYGRVQEVMCNYGRDGVVAYAIKTVALPRPSAPPQSGFMFKGG